MVIVYIYVKALDNPDALAQAKNIDFSIVNIFPGTDKKEDVIDITTKENEDSK